MNFELRRDNPMHSLHQSIFIAASAARQRPQKGRALLLAALVTATLLPRTLPAEAAARAFPSPPATPIDQSSLHTAAPRTSTADNPREKLVQNLRSSAQAERAPPSSASSNRRQRPTATRASPADLNAPDAAWLLGLLALHGLAMPADPPQAQQWFERAYMLSHPLAPAGLAWCQLSGCVTRPNPAAALQWAALVRRVDAGLASYLEWYAARDLAPLREGSSIAPHGSGVALPVYPPPELQKLLLNAATLGNPQALNELGLEYVAAGDLSQALTQFNAAAARSEAAAANIALLNSRMASTGPAAPGAAQNNAADWYQQARRYHRGEGVPSNYAEAVRLYQLAASSGETRARKMLELIFSRPAQDGTVDIGWMQQLAALDTAVRSSAPPIAPLAGASYSWQRDPTPLYALVPSEWRSAASPR